MYLSTEGHMEWWHNFIHNWKDFGSNAFSSKTKRAEKKRILFMLFPLWWILFITYCMGKVPVGVSQKRAVMSPICSKQSAKTGRRSYFHCGSLKCPLLCPRLTCGTSNEFCFNELGGEKSPMGTFCHQLSMFSF